MKIDIGDLYQHGDVLVKRIEKLPDGLKKADYTSSFVLAEGEAHNHFHRISDVDSATLLIDDAGNKFLNVTSPVTIVHEEHSPIEIDIGLYSVGIVQEYDHTKEESRAVLD